MPNEGRKFRAVDATWRRVMAAVRKAPEVLVMCSDDELLKNLIEANKFLEQVQSVTSFRHSKSVFLSQLQGHRHWEHNFLFDTNLAHGFSHQQRANGTMRNGGQ